MSPLTILADENIHRAIVVRLQQDGHRVLHVGDLDPGIPDDEVVQLALDQQALLITHDTDFGELVFRRGHSHAGVLLIRLASVPFAEQAESIARVMMEHGSSLMGAFSVLTPGKLRIRHS